MSNRPRHTEGYTLKVQDEEVFLFHPTQGKILSFNPTASLIWQLCNGERTVAEITELIAAAFPAVPERINSDVENTLQALVEQEAIEFV